MDDDEILDAPDNRNNKSEDELHVGLRILAFCIPLAGAIIYFTTDSRYPNKKQQACTAALIGIGFGLVMRIISTIMGGM